MIILDTDHVVVLKYSRHSNYATLTTSMETSPDQEFVTTTITLEEQLRGWLALIHRTRSVRRQVSPYERLNELVDFFGCWRRLAFDAQAAERFEDLRHRDVRTGRWT